MSMTGVTPRQPPRLAVLMFFVILAAGINPVVAQQIAVAASTLAAAFDGDEFPGRTAEFSAPPQHHPLAGGPED